MESPSGVEVVDCSSAVLQLVESGDGAAILAEHADRKEAQKD
jgi:DNA-binding transcriptional LysR family regulator